MHGVRAIKIVGGPITQMGAAGSQHLRCAITCAKLVGSIA